MTEENTLVAKSTDVIPTDSESFKSMSPDHKRASHEAQEGLERQVADRTARLAQAYEPLIHEIKERQHSEAPEKGDADWAAPPSDYGPRPSRTTVIVLLACIALGCAIGTFFGTRTGDTGFSIVVGAMFSTAIGTVGVFLHWLVTVGR